MEELINDVIEWGYNNDELKDFYDEHWDVLTESDSIIFLKGCLHSVEIASTSFELFRYNSKNKYYYQIKGDGDFSDLIDTADYFNVLENQDDDSVINDFKLYCDDAFYEVGDTIDDDDDDYDDDDDDDDDDDGHIKFYD
ncbi:hypothetical protein N8Z48_02105 [Algibacter sp.]|nr:hypothetical protein [Algibacter sp.]